MKTLHHITQLNWAFAELNDGSHAHSYGLDVPVHTSKDAWWMPQAYAARLLRRTDDVKLVAPTANLLDQFPEHTGRPVVTMTVNEAVSTLIPHEPAWWKLATAKNDAFPAAYRTHEELASLVEELELPHDTLVQKQGTLPPIRSEHRFYVLNRVVMTGAGYLQDDITYYDGAVFNAEQATEAREFADAFLETEQPLPHAFVMDVAVTTEGVFLLEFNPAWCSAWYGNDVEKVRAVVRASSSNIPARELKTWRYVPDPSMVADAERKRLLPERPSKA